MNSQKILLSHVRDALIIERGEGISEVILEEIGAVYFTYCGVRFRVTDRYHVEDKPKGQHYFGRGAAALLMESLLKHRGALLYAEKERREWLKAAENERQELMKQDFIPRGLVEKALARKGS